MPQINVGKLTHELLTAGIPVHGCASDGRIDFKDEATAEQKARAETIKANHTPMWWIEERRKAYPPIGDQLDYLYKALKEFKAQNTWDGIDEWIGKIDAVKAKYPKD